MDNKEQIWATCLGELEVMLSRAHFNTWFRETKIVKIDGDLVIIGTPNLFTREWLQKKHHQQILDLIKKQLDEIERLEYVIGNQGENLDSISKAEQKGLESKEEKKEIENICAPEQESTCDYLNNKYSFDTFVIGESNRLAHAAAIAITKNPGITYNPLFIYGGVGLGKTHLMQAIGNEICRGDKKKKIVYTTCEKFTNDFIQLVKKGKADQFKNNYRNADVLLIDDIQFLSGKEATQEEFFHTFNELHSKSKQIVVTSDRPPKAIASLEARLISRFEWGMLADINPPDIETRIAILQRKASEKNCEINEDVINYIAKNIQNNIRELEGALNRLMAYCELKNTRPSLDNIKQILGETSPNRQERNVTTKEIIAKIAGFYDINVQELMGQKRNKELVVPRQIAAYIMREELSFSFPKIGKELGGKDHTTIMHACSKIEREIKFNDIIKHEINSIKESLFNY